MLFKIFTQLVPSKVERAKRRFDKSWERNKQIKKETRMLSSILWCIDSPTSSCVRCAWNFFRGKFFWPESEKFVKKYETSRNAQKSKGKNIFWVQAKKKKNFSPKQNLLKNIWATQKSCFQRGAIHRWTYEWTDTCQQRATIRRSLRRQGATKKEKQGESQDRLRTFLLRSLQKSCVLVNLKNKVVENEQTYIFPLCVLVPNHAASLQIFSVSVLNIHHANTWFFAKTPVLCKRLWFRASNPLSLIFVSFIHQTCWNKWPSCMPLVSILSADANTCRLSAWASEGKSSACMDAHSSKRTASADASLVIYGGDQVLSCTF